MKMAPVNLCDSRLSTGMPNFKIGAIKNHVFHTKWIVDAVLGYGFSNTVVANIRVFVSGDVHLVPRPIIQLMAASDNIQWWSALQIIDAIVVCPQDMIRVNQYATYVSNTRYVCCVCIGLLGSEIIYMHMKDPNDLR